MNKIRVVIPVRGGSKGLKDKHIQLINSKPLLFWTLDQFIEEIGNELEIYISTDCEKIITLCKDNYDQIKIIKRQPDLALDNTSTEEVLRSVALNWINEVKENDYVIYASACEINRPKWILRDALKSIFKNNEIDSFMYGENSHKHLWEISHQEPKLICDWMQNYSPRQHQVHNYLIEHSGLILITKFKYWLNGRRFGGKVIVKELNDSYRHIDIHNKIDLKIASAILNA